MTRRSSGESLCVPCCRSTCRCTRRNRSTKQLEAASSSREEPSSSREEPSSSREEPGPIRTNTWCGTWVKHWRTPVNSNSSISPAETGSVGFVFTFMEYSVLLHLEMNKKNTFPRIYYCFLIFMLRDCLNEEITYFRFPLTTRIRIIQTQKRVRHQ